MLYRYFVFAGVDRAPTLGLKIDYSTETVENIAALECLTLVLLDVHIYALTLSGLNLLLSSSSATSRELLSQFSTCTG